MQLHVLQCALDGVVVVLLPWEGNGLSGAEVLARLFVRALAAMPAGDAGKQPQLPPQGAQLPYDILSRQICSGQFSARCRYALRHSQGGRVSACLTTGGVSRRRKLATAAPPPLARRRCKPQALPARTWWQRPKALGRSRNLQRLAALATRAAIWPPRVLLPAAARRGTGMRIPRTSKRQCGC